MIAVIDGVAGVGKSSTAKTLAQQMKFIYINSGTLYRAVAYIFIKLKQNNATQLLYDELLHHFKYDYTVPNFRVTYRKEDITARLYDSKITLESSRISTKKHIRKLITSWLQADINPSKNYIIEGRDMGTVVFPHADIKFFMTATLEKRTQRRYKQLIDENITCNYKDIFHEIEDRDKRDIQRYYSPLKKATDAIKIDTTEMNFIEQITLIRSYIEEYLYKKN